MLKYKHVNNKDHAMKYQALSILKPAVDLILDGKKNIEIRSWLPPEIPMKNVVIVQNQKYLSSDEDMDDGVALAIVDFTEFKVWTEDDYNERGPSVSLGRTWKEGYFTWKIENIRRLIKPIRCKAMKGIYQVELKDIDLV
ncbi:ASCH domain-containing protein [Enterobacter hormaechei]|nr:ASCH domain-containing protein [Enterobacter hormaechei]MZY57554.1 ASCH domain-containing protein [Enterobacter hormaechei]TYF75229.1 ASCH domain-containing protein [Enterobacter hormaechei]DAL81045.1 MAG TPA: activating signal cointegrator [Caudoviricetes sp.]